MFDQPSDATMPMAESAPATAARPPATPRRPRVVIVGAGFGGLAAARRLAGAPLDVTVVDRRNYHLFQPLLYQVATAGLSPAQIATPIRAELRHAPNISVRMGRVTAIDPARRVVVLEDGEIAYDRLVLATGARHSYFGNEAWERFAPGLKKIDDATEIRRRILTAFEKAEATTDPERRLALLTFVVVGGGPTGVEMAGAIAELARTALRRDFRAIDPADARVVLVEGGSRVLASFPPELSDRALRSLRGLGVEVRLGLAVTACDADGVDVGGQRIAAATIVWGAGTMASPAAKWLRADADRAGRLIVDSDFAVPGHPDIFAIGDTACATGPDGRPYPGLAPVAAQQGRHVADLLLARLAGGRAPKPFRYRDRGAMATIGRGHAVADLGGRLRFGGRVAWLLWGAVHVAFLAGFRNRLAVLVDWLWSYATFRAGARLITGSEPR